MARPGLDRHPKFRTLCRLLGEPRPHVVGYLEMIWATAYESGNPFIGDALAVESCAEYPGEAGKLANALLTCGGPSRPGFIEPAPGRDGCYQVHDLFHHAPKYVIRRVFCREERRHSHRLRRARRKNAPICDLTNAQWKQIKDYFGGYCAYCLATDPCQVMEHMTPLSRGGNHSADNVVPACPKCNGSKGTKTLLEYAAVAFRGRGHG